MSSRVSHSDISNETRPEIDFLDRVAGLLAKVDYQRVDTAEERNAIGRLRYQAYLREGAILPNPSKTFLDPYDETDNAYLFGLHVDGQLASSLRLHVASKQQPHTPSVEVFNDVLQPLIDAGKILVDSTRFVADENLSRVHRGLPYATLRLCMLAAEYLGADHLLAAVRMEHQAFYKRAFNHSVLCEPRPYPHLAKPICLMTVHFPSAADGLYRRYPFFRSTPRERQRLFDRRPRHAEAAGAAA